MGEYIPLKYYFGDKLAVRLSSMILPHYPNFLRDSFISNISRQVEDKELKARVEIITDELQKHLPGDYEEALAILLHILGPENQSEEGMFTKGYFLMPVAFFVEKYGHKHFDVSMHALVEITKRHTSEYAIRPYLALDMDCSLKYLQKWMKDSNPHVRRLVSEGTRPRLPWAKRINPIHNDPNNNLQLLENLMGDSSAYVQKSVANHLNDLSKDFSNVVITWVKEYIHLHKNVNSRLIKHGLRTLVKNGEAEAMEIVSMINNR
ncbi:DNA alkylation repair protein [Radiobacillus kanasensis]|uniref:DNA alkylation repair protein n=1 Tax=Radiobacillus kanasensis TaxID=2844358 RepID=UPI001E4D7443|nr:DNA alkylation repair protein [Radiobacillus kanasensis]UFT98428.1 DNA alkylation repair protein [Radiobacillus kanasensis]